VAFLVGLAFAGIYGGPATAVSLVVFSPVVSGRTDPLTGASEKADPVRFTELSTRAPTGVGAS
jgi:hypothetical protein